MTRYGKRLWNQRFASVATLHTSTTTIFVVGASTSASGNWSTGWSSLTGMNDFETEEGPTLSEIAVTLALILVMVMLAYAWAC